MKLLEAFNQLREDIGNSDDLFGIADLFINDSGDADSKQPNAQNAQALAQVRVREKRWAVFVTRAVDRFAKWWDACVPATIQGAPCAKLTGEVLTKKKGIEKIAYSGQSIKQLTLKDQLPPLGTS